MSVKLPIDVVYYWVGGTARGFWRDATPEKGKTVAELRDEIARMGYHAVLGSSRIGSPEGPPRA